MFRLDGKAGLVVGIANESSIAWGCAEAFHRQGAELAVTYLNAKAEPHVRPLAERVGAPLVLPLDVREPAQMDALFEAALEGVTRAMAADLGPRGIRVNTLSPGPMLTRAASGIEQFDSLMASAAARAATRRLATIRDVGAQAAFLVSDAATSLTGGVYYVDGGFNVMG